MRDQADRVLTEMLPCFNQPLTMGYGRFASFGASHTGGAAFMSHPLPPVSVGMDESVVSGDRLVFYGAHGRQDLAVVPGPLSQQRGSGVEWQTGLVLAAICHPPTAVL